jgi:hypothetical protein
MVRGKDIIQMCSRATNQYESVVQAELTVGAPVNVLSGDVNTKRMREAMTNQQFSRTHDRHSNVELGSYKADKTPDISDSTTKRCSACRLRHPSSMHHRWLSPYCRPLSVEKRAPSSPNGMFPKGRSNGNCGNTQRQHS